MITKAIALAMFVCAAALLLFSSRSPNDIYFAFISGNVVIAIFRMLIIAVLIYLSFKRRFVYRLSHRVAGGLGVALICFGIITVAIESLTDTSLSFIKPFDFLFFVGCGLLISMTSLAYKHGRKKLPTFARPRGLQLQLFPSRTFSR